MINELTGSKDCGHKLRAIDHRVEPALKEPDEILTGIALTAFRVFVIMVEFILANIAILAFQLLLRLQLNAVIRRLATALTVLTWTVLAAIVGAFWPSPKITAETAIDLVLRLQSL